VDGGHRKRIVVFGDSNAYRPGNNKTCWPALLQKMGRRQIRVINQSCNGRTTQYDSGARNGLSIIGDTIRTHPSIDHVIVALGTNDLKKKYGPPSAKRVAMGMERILQHIISADSAIRPILMTPPRLGQVNAGELAGAQRIMPSVVDNYRLMAARLQLPMIDIHSVTDIDADLETDRIHLNAAGRAKVAKAVWSYFERALGEGRDSGDHLKA
jgi:lysophospholipase L1-like esterase